MDCRQCSNDLTAYLDGEIPDSVAEQMRRHLEECRPCHAEYQELRNSASFVESHAGEIEPAPEIWNNLRARIAKMPAPTGSFGYFRFLVMNRWAAAAVTLAAMVVLALGLWGYMQHQQSERELESYMNEYNEMRTIMERLHSLQMMEAHGDPSIIEAIGSSQMENPFASIRPVSLDNPFRTEEK
jgi:negative regulator of sigma E activity